MVVRIIFSSILKIEVRISRSVPESPLEFEITRVDCACKLIRSTLFRDSVSAQRSPWSDCGCTDWSGHSLCLFELRVNVTDNNLSVMSWRLDVIKGNHTICGIFVSPHCCIMPQTLWQDTSTCCIIWTPVWTFLALLPDAKRKRDRITSTNFIKF